MKMCVKKVFSKFVNAIRPLTANVDNTIRLRRIRSATKIYEFFPPCEKLDTLYRVLVLSTLFSVDDAKSRRQSARTSPDQLANRTVISSRTPFDGEQTRTRLRGESLYRCIMLSTIMSVLPDPAHPDKI